MGPCGKRWNDALDCGGAEAHGVASSADFPEASLGTPPPLPVRPRTSSPRQHEDPKSTSVVDESMIALSSGPSRNPPECRYSNSRCLESIYLGNGSVSGNPKVWRNRKSWGDVCEHGTPVDNRMIYCSTTSCCMRTRFACILSPYLLALLFDRRSTVATACGTLLTTVRRTYYVSTSILPNLQRRVESSVTSCSFPIGPARCLYGAKFLRIARITRFFGTITVSSSSSQRYISREVVSTCDCADCSSMTC